jgi:hypothetical protein
MHCTYGKVKAFVASATMNINKPTANGGLRLCMGYASNVDGACETGVGYPCREFNRRTRS